VLYSGWLGYFSLEQVELHEEIFQPYGQVPWDDQINPLWAELVSHHVEEAWLAPESPFMRPDEERLPLACLPGATAFPPPLEYVEAALYEQKLRPAPLSPPSASSSTPTSGAVGASSDCHYGIWPALKLRPQRTPSSLRWHPFSCIRALSLS